MSIETSTTVQIKLSHCQYDIAIGSGLLTRAGEFLTENCSSRRAFVITDENVSPLYLTAATNALEASGIATHAITVPAGEASKSMSKVESILEELCQQQADRSCCVVALGGGVVGDLAGFVAATYARGLPFIQIPTTLLAQVDSSVGGKVGVNLKLAKNMAGAFWQPRGVLIDIDVLQTLPDREYRAGLAEVVKYGVILDEPFFAFLEQHTAEVNAQDSATLVELISRCCQLKAQVVQQDEREETGLRAVLNYGHTFAHAFEALIGYGKILHGEAVSVGMLCASRLAAQMGMIDSSVTDRQESLLRTLAMLTEAPQIAREDFDRTILRDKKAAAGKARFILPTKIGHVELVDNVDPATAYDSIIV